jgi:hypothetical protein
LHAKEVAEFKKKYSGGYFGYKDIQNFGSVGYFGDSEFDKLHETLRYKIEAYLHQIPENVTYSVLPILR